MAAYPDAGHRNLVPRWRYTTRTPFTAELASDPTRPPKPDRNIATINFAIDCWKAAPSVAHALDLVSVACACGRPLAAIEAAAWLRSKRLQLPGPLTAALEWIIAGAPARPAGWSSVASGGDLGRLEAQTIIHNQRQALQNGPRNVAGWLDLSLAYAVQGERDKARQAMRVALALAPSQRVVLRSAARLLVHLDRADEAHVLIRRHPRTPTDPWLMATEISLAQVLESPSLFAIRGRRFANEFAHQPAYVTELAGAVAVAESAAGEHTRARKLYALSLEEPTDNVVAHVQYLAQADRSLQVQRQALAIPSAVEARMWRAIQEERLLDAVAESHQWQVDEPYSSRPAIAASYLTLCTGDANSSIGSARAGLRANADDQLLRNNLVVALVRAGEYAKALLEFRRIGPPSQRGYQEHVNLATQGLMAYVEGRLQDGQRLYEAAVKEAPRVQRYSVVVNWAESEWQFVPSQRPRIVMLLKDELPHIPDPGTRELAKRLLKKPIDERAINSGDILERGADARRLVPVESSCPSDVPPLSVA